MNNITTPYLALIGFTAGLVVGVVLGVIIFNLF